MTLTVSKSAGTVRYKISHIWGLSGVFLMTGLRYGIWEECHRGQIPFLSHYVTGMFHTLFLEVSH